MSKRCGTADERRGESFGKFIRVWETENKCPSRFVIRKLNGSLNRGRFVVDAGAVHDQMVDAVFGDGVEEFVQNSRGAKRVWIVASS